MPRETQSVRAEGEDRRAKTAKAAPDDARVARGVIGCIEQGEVAQPVTEEMVEATAREISTRSRQVMLAFSYAVGELVIRRFYGGDMSAWRDRGRKAWSIRALAQRLDELGTMSASTLYRCIAGYELLSRMGGVASVQHVTATHVWAVLPVNDPDQQETLLRRADAAHWSVRELKRNVTQVRGVVSRRARKESPIVIAKRIERDARDLLRAVRERPGARRPLGDGVFSRLIRARESLEAAQPFVNPKRPD